MDAFIQEIGQLGDGVVGIVLMALFFIWSILMFFAPFFWYGTNARTKQMAREIKETNEILRNIRDGEPVEVTLTDDPMVTATRPIAERQSGRYR